MTIEWTNWTDKTIKSKHGNIKRYRQLYLGEHSQMFQRAKELIEKGEITDQIAYGHSKAKQVQTPYLVANVSKMIVDIPATLVSRAVGKATSSASLEDFEIPDDQEEDFVDPLEKQKELLNGIESRSNLSLEHKTNITHHQMDGGIVGVPFDSENGVRMEFKSRDVYFPHDDGQGCDLAYGITIEDEDGDDVEYLHVYRERVEKKTLYTSHMLYEVDDQGKTKQITDDDQLVMDVLGMDVLEREYQDRDEQFVVYWPNNKTFMHPLGRSELEGQEGKQEEINWRLTMNSIVYERNGKPRIAVSEDIFRALQEKAYERYGDDSKIDHRDLEVVTYDKNGKAMEVIQIDITKIGDIKWVKDIMKIMLMETQTSEKAVDFFSEGTSAQSGIAKFYDLFMSILKAEQISEEYIHFLQKLYENCLWIAKQDDDAVMIERPRIQLKNMMPIARKELIEQEGTAYKGGTQALKTTVENQNPTASDEWIEDEVTQIEEDKTSQSSTPAIQGRDTLNNLLDNRNPNGTVQGASQGGGQT